MDNVRAENKDYIMAIMDVIFTLFDRPDFKAAGTKVAGLNLLKDCMFTGSHYFSRLVAKSELFTILENFAYQKQGYSINSDQFKGILYESIKAWGEKYKFTNDPTRNFYALSQYIEDIGKLPSKYTYIDSQKVDKFLEVPIPLHAFDTRYKPTNVTVMSHISPKKGSPSKNGGYNDKIITLDQIIKNNNI